MVRTSVREQHQTVVQEYCIFTKTTISVQCFSCRKDVASAKWEILSASEHLIQIHASCLGARVPSPSMGRTPAAR